MTDFSGIAPGSFAQLPTVFSLSAGSRPAGSFSRLAAADGEKHANSFLSGISQK